MTSKAISAAAAAMGRVKSAKKSAAARENGRKGGRPMTRTVFERLEELARKFNSRAEASLDGKRFGDGINWGILNCLTVCRLPQLDSKGEECKDLTVTHVEFDFRRQWNAEREDAAWRIQSVFAKDVERMGLRLVRAGEVSSEVGGGPIYCVEI